MFLTHREELALLLRIWFALAFPHSNAVLIHYQWLPLHFSLSFIHYQFQWSKHPWKSSPLSVASFLLDVFFFFLFLLFFKFNLYCIFYYHLVTIYPKPLAIPTLLSMSWVLFHFTSIPPPPNHSPTSYHLLSIYESIPIFIVSSVYSLDSIYEWNHMVFVFLWLAYFT